MKKLIILGLSLITSICLVISGMTLAFYTDSSVPGEALFTMSNLSMTSVVAHADAVRVMDAGDIMKPSWTIHNDGSVPLTLRVKVHLYWVDAYGIESAPAHSITLSNSYSNLCADGWYTLTETLDRSEVMTITAEINVHDVFWEGQLNVRFEAEGSEVKVGGGYE